MPVFDPLDDELSFPWPFERTPTTYRFTRPMHRRLVEAVLASEAKCFFHAVESPAVEGVAGCVARVATVVEEEDSEGLIVSTVCVGRGRMGTAESQIPFTTASIELLADEPGSDLADLERAAFAELSTVAELSAKLEARGPWAAAADDLLGGLVSEVAALEDEALGLSKEARYERASFFLAAKTALPHADAVRALATTDTRGRFETTSSFLRDVKAELVAKAALEALEPDPAPARLRRGQRVAFFWSRQDGWFDATVVAAPRPGWYRVRWDIDGTESDVPWDAEHRARWRVSSS